MINIMTDSFISVSLARNWHRLYRLTRYSLLSFSLSLLILVPAQAETDLIQFSLEDLMAIEITSVAKKSQNLFDAAAAISVISREDILRSTATNIPELLRQVPGVQVSRIDASRYAVSIRGFSGRFSGKLLVLLDGRSLYTPLFSGVYWEAQDVLLEDVERIEVIRGPGGTLWGANAVNGIINIITQDSAKNQNTLLQAAVGTHRTDLAARYAGALGEHAYYRLYAKVDDHSEFDNTGGEKAFDAWDQGRVGFRLDLTPSGQDHITLQGDLYQKKAEQTTGVSPPPFGFTSFVADTANLNGNNLMLRWNRELAEGDSWQFQAYYDQVKQDDAVLDQTIDTLDLDFQHRFQLSAKHELIWGLNYRHIADELTGTFTVDFTSSKQNTDLYSLFAQIESSLQDNLTLTLGSKFEHNHYTGLEYQPSVRLQWRATHKDSLWASVSRAVKTPSRVLRDGNLNYLVLGTSVFTIQGNQNVDSEILHARELGYRHQFASNLTLDATAFSHQYEQLISSESLSAFVNSYDNLLEGKTYGLELAASWQVNPGWRLKANYSRLEIELETSNGGTDSSATANIPGSSPRNMVYLNSQYDLSNNVDIDVVLYYMSKLSSLPNGAVPASIDAYTRLDLRWGWRPRRDLELSLSALNLLDKQHPEFIAQDVTASEVPRELYGQIKFTF